MSDLNNVQLVGLDYFKLFAHNFDRWFTKKIEKIVNDCNRFRKLPTPSRLLFLDSYQDERDGSGCTPHTLLGNR
jgi:hypothetical protein